MHRCGREGVRLVLVEGEVDVRKREPGAVGLAVRRDRHRRLRHGRGGPLDRGGNVFAAREGLEGALRGGVAGARRRSTALGPGEPLRIRSVFGRRYDLLGVDLPPLFHDLPRRSASGAPRLGRLGRGRRRRRWRRRRLRWARLGRGRRWRRLRSLRSWLRFLNGRKPMLGRDVDLWRPRRDLDGGRPVDRRVWGLLLGGYVRRGSPRDVRPRRTRASGWAWGWRG
jgi:hypothetical protein